MSGSGLWFSRFACAGEGWLPLVAFGSMPGVQSAMDALQTSDDELWASNHAGAPHRAQTTQGPTRPDARASTSARLVT